MKTRILQQNLESYKSLTLKPDFSVTSKAYKARANTKALKAAKVPKLALAVIRDLSVYLAKLTLGNTLTVLGYSKTFAKNRIISIRNKQALTFKLAKHANAHKKAIVIGLSAVAVAGIATSAYIFRADIATTYNWALLAAGVR